MKYPDMKIEDLGRFELHGRGFTRFRVTATKSGREIACTPSLSDAALAGLGLDVTACLIAKAEAVFERAEGPEVALKGLRPLTASQRNNSSVAA